MNPSQARRRLFFGQLAGMLILIFSLLATTYAVVRSQFVEEMHRELRHIAAAVVFSVEFDKAGRPDFRESAYLTDRRDKIQLEHHESVAWLDSQFREVHQNGRLTVHGAPVALEEFLYQASPSAYVFVLPARDSSGRITGYAQVARSSEPLERDLHRLMLFLAGCGLATTLCSGLALWVWSGRALKEVIEQHQRLAVLTGSISHELRSPMTALRANAQSLQLHYRQMSPHDLEVSIGELHEVTGDLAKLLDALLFLAKGPEHSGPPAEPVLLQPIVDSVMESLGPLASERGIELVTSGSPGRYPGDGVHFQMVLHNLVENALRYTSKGGKVAVLFGRGQVQVQDNGVGISAEDIKRIFEPFWRADRSRSRHTGGSGLGLAIVSHVANLHGARLSVESQVGKGSVFRYQWVQLAH